MSEENPPLDDIYVGDKASTSPLQENIKSRATWTRFLFMLISGVLVGLAAMVCSVIVLLGFFWVLFTGEVNRQVQEVGQSIAAYVYAIIRYLTFNTDQKPFPLGGDWPSGRID